MANYNRNKKLRTVASVVCGALSIAAVAGASASLYLGAKNNGWFDKTDEDIDDTVVTETLDETETQDGTSEDVVYEFGE